MKNEFHPFAREQPVRADNRRRWTCQALLRKSNAAVPCLYSQNETYAAHAGPVPVCRNYIPPNRKRATVRFPARTISSRKRKQKTSAKIFQCASESFIS